MRRFSQRKKSKFGIFSAGFILILLTLILLVFKSAFFIIRKIEVSLDKNLDCVNVDQLKNTSGILGQNIFFVDSLNTEKKLKGKFICVKRVTLSKNFPDKVKLDILGREPKAKLLNLNNEATNSASIENIATPSAEASAEASLVDREGVIFSKNVDNLNIPKIFLMDNHGLESTLEILEKLKEFGIDVKTTMILDNSFLIFSSPKIVFGLSSNVGIQIASLQLILQKAKIDNESLEFIDLRFDKPIVRFARH